MFKPVTYILMVYLHGSKIHPIKTVKRRKLILNAGLQFE
jgi:hypothetical protein